jgi:hypothetical protein
MQPLWKQAISHAAAPLEALQAQSLANRQAMIEEAKELGAAAMLRVDAVKALQQRWQAEAHTVPMDRRQEQKLWDAFRKPIDDAFNRKTQEREKAQTTLNARDRSVLDAAKALEAANASGDAQAIRSAMAGLDAALSGQAQAQAEAKQASVQEDAAKAAVPEALPADGADATAATGEEPAAQTQDVDGDVTQNGAGAPEPEPAPAPVVKPKPVIAVRGDDRPGMKKEAPALPAGRAGKWNDRKDAPRVGRDSRDGKPDFNARGDDRQRGAWQEAPRLGDAAFRAQREALEHAEFALRKLAAQAHGEAMTHLLTAWEKRDASLLPSAQELGPKVNAATRSAWQQAVAGEFKPAPKASSPAEALLRLEMAAEVPTPAEHISARRMLQLQLLTRRNDPAPVQTWGQDAALVFSGTFSAEDARRLQNAVKVLLKR